MQNALFILLTMSVQCSIGLRDTDRVSALYTLSQKNVPTYFCSVSAKYIPISIKIGRRDLELTFKKLCKKCPLHLKYVLALPWEISGYRSNRQRGTVLACAF